MHLKTIIASALLLLVEVEMTSSTVISHLPNTVRRRNYLEKDMEAEAHRIMRRATNSSPPSSSGSLAPATPNSQLNQTISQACVSDLNKLTSVENQAGLAACYNIMQYDQNQGVFEADLRLYSMFKPTGDFANIPINDVMIALTYPSSTTFQSLTKRSTRRDLTARQQATALEVQQYTLFGTFQQNLNLGMLNDTQLMSLMLPVIKLNAALDNNQAISTNVSTSDGAWFVIGQFTNNSQSEVRAGLVTGKVATAAIAAAAPFILPGQTLGIFPTGLIVTLSWTGLFILAYGLGTLGRIQYRQAYRKRKAMQGGRTGMKI
jgi:hypothetical protein